jgi:hypothetical protein
MAPIPIGVAVKRKSGASHPLLLLQSCLNQRVHPTMSPNEPLNDLPIITRLSGVLFSSQWHLLRTGSTALQLLRSERKSNAQTITATVRRFGDEDSGTDSGDSGTGSMVTGCLPCIQARKTFDGYSNN